MKASDLLAELALIEQMPLTYNSFVIEYTSRCNARCGMCYQSAGPKGSDVLGRATLDIEVMRHAIEEAIRIEAVAPRLHITGGEGFLHSDTLLTLLTHGREVGFVELTTTTNAFWARDLRRAMTICARSRKAGMTSMEISWDHWHEPYISSEAVSNCLDACHANGIESNLRILSSRSHCYEKALQVLRPASLERATQISCAPILPTGRAAVEIDVADVFAQGSLGSACHGALNLTVNPQGHVFPCCSGIDQTNEYSFGNLKEKALGQIVRALDQSLLARILVFRGVHAVAELIREVGLDVGQDYTSICHQCWFIFSKRDYVQAVEAALAHRRTLALQAALRSITDTNRALIQ